MSRFRWILYSVICLTASLLFLSFISTFWLLATEDEFLKKELNNAYISNNYQGWKKYSSENQNSFLVPENWFINKSDSINIVEGPNGERISQFAIIRSSQTQYSNRSSFLSAVLGEDIVNISYSPIKEFVPIDLCNFGELTCFGKEHTASYFYLSLKENSQEEIFFIFPTDIPIGRANLVDIVQAISFSFSRIEID